MEMAACMLASMCTGENSTWGLTNPQLTQSVG